MGQLEDIYRPYKPKRRTRAMIAKEKGLEPLADTLLLQLTKAQTPEELTQGFLNPEQGVNTPEDALQGAMDILAERISDDAGVRAKLKSLYHQPCRVETTAAGAQASVYRREYD